MTTAAEAKIEITAGTARLPAALRAALKAFQGFSESVGSALVTTRGKSTEGWMGHAIGQVGGNLATRGIDLLVDQGKQVLDFERALTRFGIAARLSTTGLGEVRNAVRGASSATGLGAEEILRGARAYVDIAGAESYTADKMTMLARVAQASQSDVGDLAQVMFQLEHAMHIRPDELENTFSGLINMSKDGAVHFAQMQAEINELAPQAARYGMVGRAGANELAALMQVARTGFGTVAEMGTGITRVFTGLTMHASKFKKYGVDVFDVAEDGTKSWRKFSDIFNDIRTNNILSKDPELLRKAFGRSEADRTIRLWMEGTEQLKRFEEAGRVDGVVMQDLGTFAASSAGRMDISFEKLKNKIAETFTPERIDSFVNAVEGIGSALEPTLKIVGKLADGLGEIYAIGQKLGGWSWFGIKSPSNETNNPWAGGRAKAASDAMEEEDRKAGREVHGRETHLGAIRDANSEHLNYIGYEGTVFKLNRLQGGENAKPTDAAIREAVTLSAQDPKTSGGLGISTAASRYLEHVSKEQIEQVTDKMKAEFLAPYMKKLGDTITDAIRKSLAPQSAADQALEIQRRLHAAPVVVNMDGNKVSDGIGNASNVRRR